MRDIQKARLYKAEQAVRLAHGTDKVSYAGAVEYIRTVEASDAYVLTFCDPPRLNVSQFFGSSKAYYTPGTDTLTLPAASDGAWAYNSLVLLHEMAHHLEIDSHGPRFAGAFLYLVRTFEGDDAADALVASFTKNGVRVIHPRVRATA